jgi:signal transduction histidine kinase/CheY-like chemotaxis protein
VLRTAAEVFAQQAVVTLGGLLVIFLATILVYRGISDPIRRLDRDVTRGMNASVTEPLIEAGPAEIRQLARNFNSLIGKARDELAHRERSDEQARELTARLDRSQRMESLGQLAGGVAHDFNNLLAVILNYTEFVRDALPGDSPVREDLEEVRRAAERAADLTRQLLIFARREVMKLELLDVNAVVAGLEGMLRRTIGEHIELTTALAGPLPAVRADRGQLDQVLMNLALNARDAMPAGGRMVIETADVTLDDECASFEPGVVPGRYVRLTVSDTGEGMSAEVAARALEPFFTTKPAGRGTGLGLATVYGIVTRVGGTVRIYSEVGHGTLVAVQLPVADGVAGPAPAREEEPVAHATGAGRIVLVEDESAVLLAAVRILSATGYSVEGLSDSAAALRALADPTVRIDLLITDVAMPGMSGLELARRAREVRPGLPVLLMTGYSQEVVARQAEAPDGGAVVQKPFTRRSLLQAVREALANAAVP